MNRQLNRTHKLTLEPLEDRCLLSAGFLDPTFDFDGVVTTQVGNRYDYGRAVTVYPAGTTNAGKVVVVGGAETGKNFVEHFALVRYNADGSLDPTFGSGGSVVQSIVRTGDAAMAVALVGDKVLVAGDAFFNTSSHPDEFALARFNADGTLDKTFGTNGIVLTAFGKSEDQCTAMVVQPDGKIVLAGTTNAGTGSVFAFAAARYNPNGMLDTTFGNGGLVTVKVAESLEHDPDRLVDLALSGDKIVLVGSAIYPTRNIYVVRLTAAGQLDPTFGTGGVAQPGQGQYPQLAAQSDGKLDVSANFNFSMNVTRLLPSGAIDTGFGTGGTASLPWSLAGGGPTSSAIRVDPLGRIVIGGFTNPSSGGIGPMVIARFTANGALDPTFGVGGFNTTGNTLTASGGLNSLVGLTLQPDGKALLVSTEANTWKFAVARFTGDPALLAASLPKHAVAANIASDQVQPLLAEAEARWRAAGADTSILGAIDIRIADLGGTTLGLASGHTIWLDANAAGWSWFVDPTPRGDSEFTTPGNQGEQNRMDLLTVLMHEIGHLLGHEHKATGVMRESLAAGTRYTPGHDSIDWFFALGGVEVNDMGWGLSTSGARQKAR